MLTAGYTLKPLSDQSTTSCTHIDCINEAFISVINVHTGSSMLVGQKDTVR